MSEPAELLALAEHEPRLDGRGRYQNQPAAELGALLAFLDAERSA